MVCELVSAMLESTVNVPAVPGVPDVMDRLDELVGITLNFGRVHSDVR